jgi:hypothetical protein
MRILAAIMPCCALLGAGLAWTAADDKAAAKKDEIPKELIGTWEQVIAQVGNQINRPDAAGNGTVKHLHVTQTHFNRVAFLSKTKQLLGVVGGRCAFAGGKYSETIEYADETARKTAMDQKPLEFTIDLKNDMLVLKRVEANPDYSEVWKRVK